MLVKPSFRPRLSAKFREAHGDVLCVEIHVEGTGKKEVTVGARAVFVRAVYDGVQVEGLAFVVEVSVDMGLAHHAVVVRDVLDV